MADIKDPIPLDDGQYPCFWGGYEVWLDVLGAVSVGGIPNVARPFTLRLRCDVGIRTMKAEALLTVKAGMGYVKVKERSNG